MKYQSRIVGFYVVVDNPDSAVNLCVWIHEAVKSGRERSVSQALKTTRKDRKSVRRFKNLYYLNVQNQDLYKEV